ncbi:MAG TPA: class I SAM-dependent methyltransferase [Acidimicrobiales bacterium]|nr:class I SAM-dependent methyltransferase [Acidimicrobiales bacterium]
MLYENRRRAEIFGDDPEQYDRSRPSYPDAMLDDLLSGLDDRSRVRVLDVGCGTGIAARQFVRRGCVVLGVEADPRMAAVARGHGLEVEVSRFESWDDRTRRFDLLTAGQSWHWVDPDRGAVRAAEVLESGGRVGLFWNVGRAVDEVQRAFDEVYERLAPPTDKDSVLVGSQDTDRFRRIAEGLRRCGRFSEPETASYEWDQYYPAGQWLDQLQTHSDHRLLSKDAIAALLHQLGEVITSFGGGFTMKYKTSLITARKKSDT